MRKSERDAESKRWKERMSGKDKRDRGKRVRKREIPKQIERTSHQYRNYVSTMQTQSKQCALFVQQITHLLATGHGIEMATFLIRRDLFVSMPSAFRKICNVLTQLFVCTVYIFQFVMDCNFCRKTQIHRLKKVTKKKKTF